MVRHRSGYLNSFWEKAPAMQSECPRNKAVDEMMGGGYFLREDDAF